MKEPPCLCHCLCHWLRAGDKIGFEDRRKLRFPTLESITKKRRLRWYQSMRTRPGNHSIHLATLFGSFDWEKIADFGLDGSLTHRALPALRQLADDLTRFLPSWPGFVWGWDPMFLNHDFSGVSEYSASNEATAQCVVVPVSVEAFCEDVQGSNLHQCPECKARFSTKVGMFLHRTKVNSYKSPQVVYFKGNTCPRCKSLFATEKSANDHYRRNLKVFCETEGPGREQCSSKKSCVESAQQQRKKRKRAPHAANAVWSLWIRGSGRSSWLVPAEAQALVGAVEQAAKARTQEKANLIPWVQEE